MALGSQRLNVSEIPVKIYNFNLRNYIQKWRLENGGQFVRLSVCESYVSVNWDSIGSDDGLSPVVGAKPSSEPIPVHCKLNSWEQNLIKTYQFQNMNLEMPSAKWHICVKYVD